MADAWFSVRRVADGITLVTELHVDSLIRANIYHVRGAEADLIVDAGTGIAPLAWVLGGLTEVGKRVIAVATHTHYDHVGGMHEFAERLVHPREKESLAGRGQFASLLAQDFPVAWQLQVENDDHHLPDVLIDAIPHEGFDPREYIGSYVKTIARLRSLAGIRMVCPGHDDCFDQGRLRELCDAYLSRRG